MSDLAAGQGDDTATNADKSVSDLVTKQMRSMYRGAISLPGDPDFLSSIGNVANKEFADRRPSIVFRPLGVSDVQKAVKFATEHSLPLAVKCHGHGCQGSSCPDGGVLINLELMRSCEVDPEKQTVRVGGGCRNGDIDRELEAHNLAVPIGTNPDVGIGGLALHGGGGLLMKRLRRGTCDCIVEMDVVLADGSLVRVSRSDDPVDPDNDPHPAYLTMSGLLWAMKGSGGNFGIVTSFVFSCFGIPSSVYGGLRVQPNVGGGLRDLLNANARLLLEERDFSSYFFMANPPEGPPGGITAHHVLHFGSDQAKIDGQMETLRVADAVPDFGDFRRQTYHSANVSGGLLPPLRSSQYWRAFVSYEWTPDHAAKCDEAFAYVRSNPVIANGTVLLVERWSRDFVFTPDSCWSYNGAAFILLAIVGWDGARHTREEDGMPHVEAVTGIITEGGHWKTQEQMGQGYANYSMTYYDESDKNDEVYASQVRKLAYIKEKLDPNGVFGKKSFKFEEGTAPGSLPAAIMDTNLPPT